MIGASSGRPNASRKAFKLETGPRTRSPRELRVLGPVSNLNAFRDAFGLPDDAPIMRPPEQRIEIW